MVLVCVWAFKYAHICTQYTLDFHDGTIDLRQTRQQTLDGQHSFLRGTEICLVRCVVRHISGILWCLPSPW